MGRRVKRYILLLLFLLLPSQAALGQDHSSGPIRLVKVPTSLLQAQADQKGDPSPKAFTRSDVFRPVNHFPHLWTSWSIEALVRAVAVDPVYVWIGTTHGVLRYNRAEDNHTLYTTRDGLMSNVILTIRPDPKTGGAWFGTYGGGLTHFNGASWMTYTPFGAGITASYGANWKPYQTGQGLGDLWVYDLTFDSDGKMWVATWKGASRFDGKIFKTYTTKDGLADSWVYTMSLDRKGHFWFGTEGGVTFHDGKNWKTWTHQDGLGAEAPDEAEERPSYYPLPTPRHHQQQSKQVMSYNPNYVLCSVIDQQGRIWFGTWGAGLARFDGKKWKNYTTKDGLAGNVVNALAMDKDGVLWIGTNGGVSRMDRKGFVNYNQSSGIVSDSVYAIAVDEENHKWFGSYGGLTRYTGP